MCVSSELTSSNDHDRPGEQVLLSQTCAHRQDLTRSEGLLVQVSIVQDPGVEVAGAEEVDVHPDAGLHADVARRVLGLQALDLGHGDEVAAHGEVVEEPGRVAEPLEDDALGELGIQPRETVRHCRAEAVARVRDAVELVLQADGQLALGRLLCESLQCLQLEKDLNLIDGVALGRGADAKAVPGEGRVAMAVDGGSDVGVVVLVEGKVPVAAVKADAVREDLQSMTRAGVRLAVCCCQFVGPLDGVILPHVSASEVSE